MYRRSTSGVGAMVLAWTLLSGGVVRAQADPTGSWSPETDGESFWQGASATDGVYMYIFGSQLRRYDPVNNSWSTLALPPAPSNYTAGAYYNGRLFSFGGFDLATFTLSNSIHAYTIATNSWSALSATISTPVYFAAAATLGSKIYVTGGLGADFSNQNNEFDPTNDSIVGRATMPAGAFGGCMAVVEGINKVYAIGGFNGAYLDHCYEYTPPDNDPSTANDNTWATKAPMKSDGTNRPRYGLSAFTLNNRVYVTGGSTPQTGVSDQVFEYNPSADSWVQRASMASTRYAHGAVAISGKGYVYGGPPHFTKGEEYTPPSFNQAPVAQAGPDRTIEGAAHAGTSVTLDGTESFDINGDTLTYEWKNGTGQVVGTADTLQVTLPLGTHAFTLKVSDGTLEASDGVSITVRDTTAPAITQPANIQVACSVNLLVPVTYQITVADACDSSPAVVVSPPSGSGFPIGTTAVTVTATDASGNVSTRSFNVIRAALQFTGFLSPLGGADAGGGSYTNPLKAFKLKSTIPVKFTASCDGVDLVTGVHTLAVAKYSDETTSASEIDATPQDEATPGNQFRLTDTQWHFNLDTNGTGMSAGIWQLTATLSDGSKHTAWIQIK